MTTMSTTTTRRSTAGSSTSVRAGLAFGALVGAINFAFIFYTGDWGSDEPPRWAVVVGGLIGLVSVIAAFAAWRSANRKIIRIDAAALIINALMVVPGLFLDLTSFIRFASSVLTLATVPAVVLMMRRDRSAGILDD